jgi:hypothetical protein
MPRVVTADFVLAAYTVALLIVAGGILFTLYRFLTQVISTAMLWALSGLIVVACYSYRSELYDVGKWLYGESAIAHAMPHGTIVAASVPTREILESMRRSMSRP